MIPALRLIARPRTTLAGLAERPRLGPAIAAVAVTGVASVAIQLAATLLEPTGRRTSRILVSLSVPFLLAAFWLLSAWMIGAAARLMGAAETRSAYLAVSGHTYPVLVGYAAIALGQAASGGVLSQALGLLSLPLLSWFLALSALAARSVYRVSTLPALALALLPYAAMSAALLLLVVTVAALTAIRP